jgi:hypothetical protein
VRCAAGAIYRKLELGVLDPAVAHAQVAALNTCLRAFEAERDERLAVEVEERLGAIEARGARRLLP